MKLDLSMSGLTAHQQVETTPFVREMAEILPLPAIVVLLLPEPTAFTLIHEWSSKTTFLRPAHEMTSNLIGDIANADSLLLDYSYADAGNNKTFGDATITGRMTARDLSIILSALNAEDGAFFIPSQIGLEDLQGRMSTAVDMDGDDHVWHRFRHLVANGAGNDSQEISAADFVEACEVRLREGFDLVKAVEKWW